MIPANHFLCTLKHLPANSDTSVRISTEDFNTFKLLKARLPSITWKIRVFFECRLSTLRASSAPPSPDLSQLPSLPAASKFQISAEAHVAALRDLLTLLLFYFQHVVMQRTRCPLPIHEILQSYTTLIQVLLVGNGTYYLPWLVPTSNLSCVDFYPAQDQASRATSKFYPQNPPHA